MPFSPLKHAQPWTPEEVSTLERRLAEGTSLFVIARQMGRSRGAVTAKANALKASRVIDPHPSALMSPILVTRPVSHNRRWTPEEVTELKRLTFGGQRLHVIARELGRTPEAVRTKARDERVSRKAPYRPS